MEYDVRAVLDATPIDTSDVLVDSSNTETVRFEDGAKVVDWRLSSMFW